MKMIDSQAESSISRLPLEIELDWFSSWVLLRNGSILPFMNGLPLFALNALEQAGWDESCISTIITLTRMITGTVCINRLSQYCAQHVLKTANHGGRIDCQFQQIKTHAEAYAAE